MIGAAAFVAVAVLVGGIIAVVVSNNNTSSDGATGATSTVSPSTTRSATTSASATPTTSKVAPRDEDAAGPKPTIASFIADNNIQETPVKRGDPGSPTIDLPIPDGWEPAGENTPEWAYGAIIYTGPEAAEYSPSIVALVSKLTGNVDPQTIIDHAPGELQNMPGWVASNNGENSTLDGYQGYQLGGTWDSEGQRRSLPRRRS